VAKISGDDDSWRASGLRKRYQDWEHTPPVDPAKPKNKAKKNKKDLTLCLRAKDKKHQWRNTSTTANPLCAIYLSKCKLCGMGQWNYNKLVKKAYNKKQKAKIKETCSSGHVWVWQKVGEPKLRYGSYPTWRSNYAQTEKQQWEKRCAGCNNLAKTIYTEPNEVPPAIQFE